MIVSVLILVLFVAATMKNYLLRSEIVCVWVLWLVAAATPAEDRLPKQIEEHLAQPHFKTAQWGFLFVDLKTAEVVMERNSEKLFVPASTTKLYSTAAALDALGADYRFHTPIHRRGNIDDQGHLEGDLILVASGDPTMGGRTTEKGEIAFHDSDHIYANWAPETKLTEQDPLAGIKELAKKVSEAGIKKVNGEVLVDDRLFVHTEGSGSGPQTVTPIMVNDNVFDFTFEPTEPGQAAKCEWRPHTGLFKVEFDVQTVKENEPLETWIRPQGEGRIRVSGKIPSNKTHVVRVYEVPDPAAFARALLFEALRKQGVEVSAKLTQRHPSGKLPEREACKELPKVAELISPPFAENAKLILKVSHNLHASELPLLVAVKHEKRTLSEGLKLEGKFFSGGLLPDVFAWQITHIGICGVVNWLR